ncbi:hypothetical protein SUGI_0663560 [Cryptomeria japonica]|nr:hypothetical protein SUGI_0663560 [Cryptomeria japonica]
MRLGKYGGSVVGSAEAPTRIKTLELLSDGRELRMFHKSPYQIWQSPEDGLNVNAVHEKLRRQGFWQSCFEAAGYEEAEPTSCNVTLVSRNPSLLPFLASQFKGLCRTQPLDHESPVSQA